MASQYGRLLDTRTLSASQTQGKDDVFDGGAGRELELDVRVVAPGTGGNVKVQHAAVNEEDSFRDVPGATWALTGTGGYLHVASYLRYLRWVTDAAVTGTPKVIIDLMVKE